MKLKRTIYGLEQASKKWNEMFNDFLCKKNFMRLEYDPCLDTSTDKNVLTMIVLYVDDIIVASTDTNALKKMKQDVRNRFEVEDFGEVENFIGIKILRTRRSLFIH